MEAMGGPEGKAAVRVGRHYGLDWLRIGAFALLIPYHIGMYFAPGNWVVHSAVPVDWLAWPLGLVRPWRLCLLFLVSGYASRALLGKLGSLGAFARSRSLRLLLPLAFGMVVIVAPQTWVRLRETGYAGSFACFFFRDRGSVTGADHWTLVEHLWFLDYLWAYTMALIAAMLWLPAGLKARFAALPNWLALGQRALLAPLAFVVLARLSILFVIPQGGWLLTDWHGHVGYLPPFLFGFALAGAPALWPALARTVRPALMLSLACGIVLLWADATWPDGATPGHLATAGIVAASAAMGWAMPLALAAAAERWLRRDHPLRATAAEAVFPLYLVHQTIIVVVGWWLRPIGLGFAIAFPILLAATVGGGIGFYLIGREIGWLRPLIGLSGPAPRRRHRPLPHAAAAP
jgi:peptidoglycan/LPS O-acetylase OafA/YrhL